MANDVPGGLEPGEQLLQFLVPSWQVRLAGINATLRRMLSGFFGGVLVGLGAFLGLGLLHPLLGAVVGGLLFALGLVFGVGWAVRRHQPPGRWWVTTRRFVWRAGGQVTTLPLPRVGQVEVDAQYHAITLHTDTGPRRFEGVAALDHLWGAVLFGRGWGRRELVLPEQGDVHPMVAWWANRDEGLTRTRGVLVLRPESIAWIPQVTTRTGARILGQAAGLAVGMHVRTVSAIPPLDPVFLLLQRLPSAARFDEEVADVIRAWGGWRHPPGALRPEVSGPAGAETLTLRLDGATYTAPGIAGPDWPAIAAAWVAAGRRA